MGQHEELVGIAGILGLFSFSTLVQSIYSTQNTTSLPWPWIIINISAQSLSFTYGIINNAYGIYIPNILFLAGLIYILSVKIKNKEPSTLPSTEIKEK